MFDCFPITCIPELLDRGKFVDLAAVNDAVVRTKEVISGRWNAANILIQNKLK